MANILITEVNSNATGGDFFELYNYGNTDIDLTGWRWNDSQATNAGSGVVVFPSGTTLAAGKVLVVLAAASTAIAAFKTAWSIPANVDVVAFGGPSLGKGDAVVVFDSSGNAATAYNDTATVGVAATAAQRLIYNDTTGQLMYDADGSGKKAAVLIGVLDDHSELHAADLWVI
jgi:Lamin Tail Domain